MIRYEVRHKDKDGKPVLGSDGYPVIELMPSEDAAAERERVLVESGTPAEAWTVHRA